MRICAISQPKEKDLRNSKQLLWKPEEINDVTKFYVLCQHLLSSNISGKVNPEKLSRSASSDRLLLFCGALLFWGSVSRSILHTLSCSSISVAYLCILKLQLKSP